MSKQKSTNEPVVATIDHQLYVAQTSLISKSIFYVEAESLPAAAEVANAIVKHIDPKAHVKSIREETTPRVELEIIA